MKNPLATALATTAFIGLSSVANAGIEFHTISGGDYSGLFTGYLAAPEVANDGTVLLHQGYLSSYDWNTWTKTGGLTPIEGVTSTTLSGNHMSNDSGYLLFQAGSYYDYHTPNGVIQKGRVGYNHRVIQRLSGDGKTVVGRPHSATINFYTEDDEYGVRLPLEDSPTPQNLGVNNEGNRLLVSQSNATYFADVPEGGMHRDATLTEIPVTFYGQSALSDNGLTVMGRVQELTQGCEVSNVTWSASNGIQEVSCSDAYALVGLSGDGSKVIGYSQSEGTSYVWDSINGSRDLKDIMLQNGYDLVGWSNLAATDISEDGTKIVGWGVDASGEYQAFLMEVTPICTVAF